MSGEGADGQKGEGQELQSRCRGAQSERWIGEAVGAERGVTWGALGGDTLWILTRLGGGGMWE